MVDEGIFCTTAEVLRRAGEGANATPSAEAYINDFVATAEAEINVIAGFNFSDKYATLNVDVQGMLKECAACMAANKVVKYNFLGYPDRVSAEDLINVNRDEYLRILGTLKNFEKGRFIRNA